ncbi:MAG: hypothetical protein JWQ07_5100 [Ramlibacter sp.]|nr:hypothetical protein [Ramlibacter sp.]
MIKVNGDMLILAREFREVTQKELADRTQVAQSTIAKIEGGIKRDVSEELADRLARELRFSVDFLCQEEELLSYGSSAYFYRKRATMPAPERRRIHSVVNMLRIAIRKFVKLIDIDPSRVLPQLDVEEYGQDAAKVAKAVRVMWALPDGPIRDLTALIESAGVLVVPCDFSSRLFDATSLRLSDMPPLIFINASLPGDRWRYTLAHELAHLVMHTVPHERMEEEADTFAAELLTPAEEIKPQLLQVKLTRNYDSPYVLRDLAKLKLFWRVSFQMLIYRARHLNVISKDEARRAYISMAPQRMVEAVPIEREASNSLGRVVAAVRDDLRFGWDGLRTLLNWPEDVTEKLLASSPSAAPKLRLVQS